MTNLLLALLASWPQPTEAGVIEGSAQCYADGVMKQVADNRITWGHILPDTDYRYCVAVTDCNMMGMPVNVVWPDGRIMYSTVCDCSARQDRQRHEDKGLAVEVSHWAANEYAHPVGDYLLPRDGPLQAVKIVVRPMPLSNHLTFIPR